MSYAEGPFWHAAPPENWVRSKLAAFGWFGLGSAGLQHLMPSVERQAIAKQFAEGGRRTLNVCLPYCDSKVPLNLLIDSTGIKAEGEGE